VADEPIEVLFALHPKFNIMDFAGPLEVLTTALHDAQDPSELPIFVTRPRSFPLGRAGRNGSPITNTHPSMATQTHPGALNTQQTLRDAALTGSW
jgi:transcriptional regulator GlxA family with amidase domain